MKKWVVLFTFFISFGNAFSQVDIADLINNGEPVQVKLINKTGYRIETIIICNMFFPKIENEDSTNFINASDYTDGDIVNGSVVGFEMDNTQWVWNCLGTKSKYAGKKLILEMYLADSDVLPNRKRIKTRISKIIN